MRMSVRVPLLVVGVALATVGLLTVTNGFRIVDTIYEENQEKLVALRASRAETVERYANQLENRVRTITNSETTHHALAAFVTAANRVNFVGGDLAAWVRDTQVDRGSPDQSKTRPMSSNDPMAQYYATHDRFHLWLTALVNGLGIRDVLMVAPNGQVVYSVSKGPAFGTNLNIGPWSSTGAAGAFRRAISRDDPDRVAFVDFSNRSWSPQDPLAFGAYAARDMADGLLGVVVVVIGSEGFNDIVRGTAGLGTTGETYLVGHDNLMRSDSRHLPGAAVLKQAVHTESADRAISGQSGFATITGYRGIEVLSAYQPVVVFDNAWALLAEVDAAEEYRSVYTTLQEAALIALAIAGLASLAGILTGRAITLPVVALRDSMLQFTNTRRPITVPGSERRDEIGDAARSFSGLTEEITRYVDELDREHRQAEQSAARLADEQERLRLTLDQMPGGLVILDRNLNVRLSNRQFTQLYGLPDALSEEGTPIEALLRFRAERGDYGPDAGDDYIARRVVDYRSKEARRYEDTLPGGRVAAAIRSPTADGGVVLVVADVTDLKDAQARAEAAATAKAAFLATMSHEIRTPMNGVMSMAELLDHTVLDGEQRGMTRVIRQSAEALLTVINDILDFSKIEAGRLPIERVPFELGELVEDVAELLAPRADDHGLDLIVELASDLPERVLGDPTRLRQILVNLGGNAVKFTESGSVRITARPAVPFDGNTLRLCLEVTDTGIGMTDEQMTRLFEPFAQADSSTARRFGGTGLGLSICMRLAQLMDGTITASSAPDAGSTFMVELPLGIDDPAPLAPDVPIDDAPVVMAGFQEPVRGQVLAVLAAAGVAAPVECDFGDLDTTLAGQPVNGLPTVVLLDGRRTAVLDAIHRLQTQSGSHRLILVAPRALVSTLDEATRRGVIANLRLPARRADTWRVIAAALGRATLTDRSAGDSDTYTPPPVEEARAAGVLILVAEDNPTNRLVIAKVLGRLGYAHEMAEDGAEALARWRSARYGLILTDFHMPEMDGFQLTAAVRADEAAAGSDQRIPIVALTADALAGTEERCLEAGMDGYLTKPIRTGALAETLARFLPGASALRRLADSATSAPPAADPLAELDREVFDPQSLAETFGAFDKEAFDFVAEFRRDVPEKIAGIISALQQGDLLQARHVAHSLKGAARSVGANRLGQIASDVQDALDQNDPDTAGFMAGLLEPTLDELNQALASVPRPL
ncbi:ATP-binding protein [Thalassobaculum sp.]|uniref:ATP-binding protein n=1 Tax=Thalassobaculum sp. TaxID=2022740 RepID=UPI0032ECB5ED